MVTTRIQNAINVLRYRATAKGREANRKSHALLVARNKEVIRIAKDVPCADCGGRFPPEAMDLDHTADDKEYNVAAMKSGMSIMKLLAEIAKCEVVCANCHRIRTTQRWSEKGAGEEW